MPSFSNHMPSSLLFTTPPTLPPTLPHTLINNNTTTLRPSSEAHALQRMPRLLPHGHKINENPSCGGGRCANKDLSLGRSDRFVKHLNRTNKYQDHERKQHNNLLTRR